MHLAVILTTGFLWLYTSLRLIAQLALPLPARIAIAVILLLVAQYHSLLALAFGSYMAVELPRAVMIALGWAFGAFFLMAWLTILRDVVGLLVLAFSPGAGRAIWSADAGSAVVVLLALGLATWGIWQGTKVPAVKTLEISVPGLPAAFDGYRIVQLTDLHANGLLPAPWVAAVVDATNALEPDLIVITGDLQDGPPEIRAKDVAPLAQLRARDGVLSIPGNHEYYTDYTRWMAIFRDLGLGMLENEHTLIERDGQALAVAGITDRQALSFHQPAPDLARALAGIPTGTPVILLDHRPGNARANAAAGVALQFSGHTHGGQVRGLDQVTQRFNGGFLSGRYQVGDMQLYVSNGTGLWNGFAVRVGRPSEITLVVLRPAPSR